MKISRARFVIVLVSAFAFQFISNSLLGSEVRLFPARDESFLGRGSPIAFALYWTILALFVYYLLGKLKRA